MTETYDIDDLKKNISEIYKKKEVAAYALCTYYAGLCLQRFRQKQAQNAFWNNQTNYAYNGVYSHADITKEYVGFFMAHIAEYGIELELKNNRKHESLNPTIAAFYSRFIRDVERLYAD